MSKKIKLISLLIAICLVFCACEMTTSELATYVDQAETAVFGGETGLNEDALFDVSPGDADEAFGEALDLFNAILDGTVTDEKETGSDQQQPISNGAENLDSIPLYDGSSPYVVINGNVPEFTPDELSTESYEYYSELDELGRVGMCMACCGQDIMPTEEREDISSVYPTGWEQNKYDSELVENSWLYNRSHILGFQLTGENAVPENLMTGTRYFNVEGMLPFENMVADYIRETNNHVMFRVTPIFGGDNLLAYGVQMEGYSVEDAGEGVMFNVFVYNVQPGIEIDYATGENWEAQ